MSTTDIALIVAYGLMIIGIGLVYYGTQEDEKAEQERNEE